MPFKADLQTLMQQFGGPINALATVQGVAGVVMGVVYRNPDEPEPTDEVALVIVPKLAHMEHDVIRVAIDALQAHLTSQDAKAPAGPAGGGGN